MHQKKSEVQIGKDSVGVSSDFTPLVPHHLLHHPALPPSALPAAAGASAEGGNTLLQIQIQSPNSASNSAGHGVHPHLLLSAPHKRPVMNSSLSHSKTLHSLPAALHPPHPPVAPSAVAHRQPYYRQLRHLPCAAASTTRTALRHLRRLRLRLRLLLLLSFPSLYLFLGSGGGAAGGRSPLYDFLSALAFSSGVLLLLFVSVNLLSLPSLRLLLSRSSSSLLPRHDPRPARRRSPPPVLWSIGSGGKPKVEKHQPTSGSWVQVYSNGDVYEGEFHRGKYSGSGVYYYYMSGRYEGDWVDGKYDGYGVETWARGSRYRGQYRQGLRHGYGIYRFYTGDVYAGEWSNGQSHGCGVHTCDDGSRYVGEYKWGVKHGLGHYHFSHDLKLI
ncbi:hypothetical protein Taro_037577 [Colocasia esculenta]|uniref:Uncharacterized protein n=1 Tax=Colocasia esculenta TaxID=4460 RepID=A0A843WD89_COLES|nr:hypothetical protein [Colocasia esculenta]